MIFGNLEGRVLEARWIYVGMRMAVGVAVGVPVGVAISMAIRDGVEYLYARHV